MGKTMGLVGPLGGQLFTNEKPPELTAADHRLKNVVASEEFQKASPSERREMLKQAMSGMRDDELRGLAMINPQYLAVRDEVLRARASGNGGDIH